MRKEIESIDLNFPTSEKDIPKLEEVVDETIRFLKESISGDEEAKKIIAKSSSANDWARDKILRILQDKSKASY